MLTSIHMYAYTHLIYHTHQLYRKEEESGYVSNLLKLELNMNYIRCK